MINKINIGILGPSSIALNRFISSLNKSVFFNLKGVAVATNDEREVVVKGNNVTKSNREQDFKNKYDIQIYDSFESMLNDTTIEAIYIPLPPALHFYWGKRAILNGKHVLLEKPSTTKLQDTLELIKLAKENNVALFENYMFEYHSQVKYIKNLINSKEIGDKRNYKISFTFPKREENDFRYNKDLGGGALLDCGGYTIKLATMLLGKEIEIKQCNLNYLNYNVDIFGDVVLSNDSNISAHCFFGMDNEYECKLEVCGSKGIIVANRIFTAGADFSPNVKIIKSSKEKSFDLEIDDHFLNSINKFCECIRNIDVRNTEYDDILLQMSLVNKIQESVIK